MTHQEHPLSVNHDVHGPCRHRAENLVCSPVRPCLRARPLQKRLGNAPGELFRACRPIVLGKLSPTLADS